MGFIKIDRDFLNSEYWLREPFTYGQAWVDLIGLANYADKDKFFRHQHQRVKRGQLVTSQQALADRWKWSRNKVRTYLRNLESAGMVTTESTTNYTTITIENYAFYQDKPPTKGQQNHQLTASSRPTDGQLTATQEERKKERTKKSSSARARVPTMDEVDAFIQEENLTVDAKRFVNYYDAFGWEMNGEPIKNWKAVCRKWSENEQASTGGVSDLVQAWVNGEISYD